MPARTAAAKRKAPATGSNAGARTFSLHWGSGIVEEEAVAVDKYHRTTIQLLKFLEGPAAGSYEVRFCYYDPQGRFQRSPLIVDEETIDALAKSIRSTPKIRSMLKKLVK